MSIPAIIGFSGNTTRPSRTFAFVDHIVQDIARTAGLAGRTYDIEDLGPSLLRARRFGELDGKAQGILDEVFGSHVLVVGSPTYKGSYTGLFKHVFDLIEPDSLRGKPVVLTATGGGDRHALVAEHALRPLFGFFEALTLPTAIYASERDFVDGRIISDATRLRASQAVDQAVTALKAVGGYALAAE